MSDQIGTLDRVSEFIVRVHLEGPLTLSEEVGIGKDRLTAEVIGLGKETATVQVYEDTTGLRPGDPVFGSGHPLSAVLGPGLLGNVFDGIQRPLDVLKERAGRFIRRGVHVSPLNTRRRWEFEPQAEQGDSVSAGDLLGSVQETPLIQHRILVPPGLSGKLAELAEEGAYTIEDQIAVIKDAQGKEHPVTMQQRWHIRRPRPILQRLSPGVPLITGQRVIDTFFPVAKGGTAAIPGGFGTGKTVIQHALAQWSDADIIIYIGCGERGNEMTEVLEEFPELNDPWSGHPLMERTLLIANTSDMPVSARESSIYTGVTMAEYYRDQGYDVALMADSTSRWAQALREISGRLGEMPVEEGYPAYLAARLSAFYERAGRIKTLGDREGSVTLIGAVSPPGGDFSEPVTRHTQRFTRSWWALDRDLAHKRHFPAIDWISSYSLHIDPISEWWKSEAAEDWNDLRRQAMAVLHEESGLQQLVQLVGPDALSEDQQWTLTGARLLREGFLQQNALHPVDAYAVPDKQVKLLRCFVRIHRLGSDLLDQGISLDRIRNALDISGLIRLRNEISNEELEKLDERVEQAVRQLKDLQGGSESEGEKPEEKGEESEESETGKAFEAEGGAESEETGAEETAEAETGNEKGEDAASEEPSTSSKKEPSSSKKEKS
ncbi:MAG: V-type ATP synthase subunit A [Desulfococcaceae bacterium]